MSERAVGYLRMGDDGRDAPSFTDERAQIERAARQRRLDLVRVIRAEPDADAFHTLLDLAQQTPKLTVLVPALDHLGNGADLAGRYARLIGAGARLCSLAEDEEPVEEALLAQWRAGAGSSGVGERVREAMRRKAVKGEVLGRPPYGYRVGSRHRLELIADEAAVIRLIFHLYIHDDLGIRLIARRLNEEGYRTRRGGNWSMVTIRDILRNRAYLGTYARFGVRVPGSHAALVSPEDFRKAQEKMADRRTAGGPRHAQPFLLSGLAYCGSCGNRMIGVSRRQSWERRGDGGTSSAEYRYYQCGSRTNQSVCGYHTHRMADLDAAVHIAVLAAVAARLESAPAASPAAPAGMVEAFQQRLRTAERDLANLLDGAGPRRFDRAAFQRDLAAIGGRLLAADAALRSAGADTDEATKPADRWRERQERLAADWEALTLDQRQSLLVELVERVNIHDDRVEPVLRP